MKRVVLILSLVAPVLMYYIGDFFFFFSGFGIDTELPPTSPQRIVGALIGLIPGLAVAFVALGMSLVATWRAHQWAWFAVLLVWPFVPMVAAVLMVTGVVSYTDSWWLAAVFVPLATLMYSVVGPAPAQDGQPSGPSGASATQPFRAAPFAVFAGMLALVTVIGFATLVRGAPPFASPPVPTATIGPAVLSLNEGDGTANCTAGVYPTLIITNTSRHGVSWTASANDSGITVSPASGSLDAGTSAQITLSGHATTTTFFTVTFRSEGAPTLAKIACVSK